MIHVQILSGSATTAKITPAISTISPQFDLIMIPLQLPLLRKTVHFGQLLVDKVLLGGGFGEEGGFGEGRMRGREGVGGATAGRWLWGRIWVGLGWMDYGWWWWLGVEDRSSGFVIGGR